MDLVGKNVYTDNKRIYTLLQKDETVIMIYLDEYNVNGEIIYK